MRISIVYTTARPEPRIEWMLAGLATQAVTSDDVQLVIVDALGRSFSQLCRPAGWSEAPRVVSDVVSVRPKPSPWQGSHRLTKVDWWATANARNTGAVVADADYVAFVDDRCALGPRWLATAREAERERASVVAGAYRKYEDGRVTNDHREVRYPGGLADCGGGWLYGCSFAMPLEWYLEVNGQEEGCDGLSGEDYIMGLMLSNAGRRIDFRPGMLVIQDRSSGTSHSLPRRDKGISPRDKSHAALARFGARRRTEFTPDLTELRRSIAAGCAFPGVDPGARDWYDGQPIGEAEPA